MRSITAALASASARTDGQGFRYLLELTPKGGVTRYLATDDQSIGGVAYIGEVLFMSAISERLGSSTDMQIRLFDNPANRVAAQLTAEAKLYLWAVGTSKADADLLLWGEVSDPLRIAAGEIGFDIQSRSAAQYNKPVTRILLSSDYPQADPDAIGKIKPVLYGNIKGSPCLAVDAGNIDTLYLAVNIGDTTLELTDTAGFPSSGLIQIDTEQTTYTGITGNTLTGLSVTVPHDRGATVAEVQSWYDYMVADHPVKSIDAVYVDGVRQLGADFIVFPNSNGMAMVRFYVLPTIVRQVALGVQDNIVIVDGITIQDGIVFNDGIAINDSLTIADGILIADNNAVVDLIAITDAISVTDGIQVSDDIAVGSSLNLSDPGHAHISSSSGTTAAVPTTASISSGIGSWPQNVIDGNYNSWVAMSSVWNLNPWSLLISHTIASQPGSPLSVNVTIKAIAYPQNAWPNEYGWFSILGKSIYYWMINSAPNNTIVVNINIGSYAQVEAMLVSGNGPFNIFEIRINSISWGSSAGVSTGVTGTVLGGNITKIGGASKSGSVSKTGTVTKSGGVSLSGGAIRSGSVTRSGGVSKTGAVTKAGTVNRAGTVTKTGTVILTGNSVADTKIGGIVTADVQGWKDDAAGSITGVPSALIERPDHIIRHALIQYGGATLAEVQAVDFDAFTGDKLAIALHLPLNIRDLITRIADESHGLIHYAGNRWIMRRRPDASPVPTPVRTLTDSDIVRQDNGASSIVESRSGLASMLTQLDYRSGLSADGSRWAVTGSQTHANAAVYGVRESLQSLPDVHDAAQALAVIVWRLNRVANPNRIIAYLSLTLAQYQLDVGDVLTINDARATLNVTGEVIAINRETQGRRNGILSITLEQA